MFRPRVSSKEPALTDACRPRLAGEAHAVLSHFHRPRRPAGVGVDGAGGRSAVQARNAQARRGGGETAHRRDCRNAAAAGGSLGRIGRRDEKADRGPVRPGVGVAESRRRSGQAGGDGKAGRRQRPSASARDPAADRRTARPVARAAGGRERWPIGNANWPGRIANWRI